MQSSKNAELRETSSRAGTPVSTGNPFWDMMLSLGQASSQALTAYAGAGEAGQRSERGVAHRAAAAVEMLRSLAGRLDGELGAAVAEHLTRAEVTRLAARVGALLAGGRYPRPSADWPAVPWPPI